MAAKPYQPAGYDTDLRDAEWELLKSLNYPADAIWGRGRWRDPDSARACLDAIRYVFKTGSQWSATTPELSAQELRARRVGEVDAARLVAAHLRRLAHQDTPDAKNNAMPSAAVIDSQSVKGGQLPPLSCGYDAG